MLPIPENMERPPHARDTKANARARESSTEASEGSSDEEERGGAKANTRTSIESPKRRSFSDSVARGIFVKDGAFLPEGSAASFSVAGCAASSSADASGCGDERHGLCSTSAADEEGGGVDGTEVEPETALTLKSERGIIDGASWQQRLRSRCCELAAGASLLLLALVAARWLLIAMAD